MQIDVAIHMNMLVRYKENKMEISKPSYKMSLSEEELKTAIEFYTKHKYNQTIKITHLTHLVGERDDYVCRVYAC